MDSLLIHRERTLEQLRRSCHLYRNKQNASPFLHFPSPVSVSVSHYRSLECRTLTPPALFCCVSLMFMQLYLLTIYSECLQSWRLFERCFGPTITTTTSRTCICSLIEFNVAFPLLYLCARQMSGMNK